jgi:integrase
MRRSREEFAMSVPQTVRSNRRPWNAGRVVGAKPPLKLQHIWALRTRLQIEKRIRDLAMFNLAIDSKLRGCDIVRLRIGDVAAGGNVRTRSSVIQQKTGRPVPFELSPATRASVAAWLDVQPTGTGDWLWPSRSRPGGHLTTRQYGRLVDRWMAMIGLDPANYGTHSLRRTKVSLVYKRTGNLRACQLLLGHTKLESTVRYLGIEVDDALHLSEQEEI